MRVMPEMDDTLMTQGVWSGRFAADKSGRNATEVKKYLAKE